MCSIKLVPSTATHAKGVAFCKNRIDDLENALKTKHYRFTQFNPLFSMLSKVVEDLIHHNDESLDLSVVRFRLKKMQASLEKRSIEWLSSRIHKYTDFVSKKSPTAIVWEYGTICTHINQFAGEVGSFFRQASPQSYVSCEGLMVQLMRSKRQMDVLFEGGHGGIDFQLQPLAFRPLSAFEYASNATFVGAAEYYSSQLKDFAGQVQSSGICQYIKFKPSFEGLAIKIDELVALSNGHVQQNIAALQERFAQTRILFEAQCVGSLETRVMDVYKMTLAMTGRELMQHRGLIQRKFCQYRLEIDQMKGFLSSNKNALIYKINQRLLRVKAAIDPGKVDLRVRRNKHNPSFFDFFLDSRSACRKISPSIARAEERLTGSELLLKEADRLNQAVAEFDKHRVGKALIQLRSFQMKIHFELSGVDMSVMERVLFHFIRSEDVSEDMVRRAMLRTCIEVLVAGFLEHVKEKGRGAAENVFCVHFKSMGIWKEYYEFVSKKHKIEGRNPENKRAFLSIEQIYTLLKRDWQL